MNESGIAAGSVTDGLPGTLGRLIHEYRTNKASSFHKLRYHSRQGSENVLRRLNLQYGAVPLTEIRAATIQVWYDGWSAGGKIATGHSFVAKLRTIFGFGLLMLEDRECERLCVVMNKLRFEQGQPRVAWLTAVQADAIRSTAHEHFGWHSFGLAQALQFEVMLRQKDVIGEWVPETEPGEALVTYRGKKWLRGIIWQEIDQNFTLKHKTSKKLKTIEVDLRQAPMVMEEFAWMTGIPADQLTRDALPATGPVVYCEITGLPWSGNEYRRKWRLIANKAGLPKEVRNQDSRAGGITEATEAGADIEHVKHAATHSDISQTQRYSRNSTDKIASVQAKRLQHRYRTAG